MVTARAESTEKSSIATNPNRQSVALILIGILVAVVTSILGAFATIIYISEEEKRWTELHNTLTTSLEQSSAGLTLPVWGLENAQILSIMNVTMTQREVFAITITIPSRRYQLTRDENWQIVEAQSDPTAPDLLAEEKEILHKGQVLGRIKIHVTPRFLNQELRELRQNIFILILTLDTTLILSMASLLWLLTLKPIQALQRFAATVSKGEPPAHPGSSIWFYGEFKTLLTAIVEMNTKLENQLKALRENEQLLETRVAQRTAQLESTVAELARARDEADAANRAKSEFLANMSHEIRTPMNAIVVLTALALRTILTAKQKDYLDNVKSAADSLLMIIDDILDFSKIEAGKLNMESTPFSLERVLDQISIIARLKTQEKAVTFRIDIDRDVPFMLQGDPIRLGQVLINLCTNAIKFTSQGEIELSIKREQPLSKNQEPPTAESRITLRFSIRDTGIGMNEEQIAKLFKPFSQADSTTTRNYGGTGLGLVISKQIIALMGGSIGVSSVPGLGSEFHFTATFGVVDTAASSLPYSENHTQPNNPLPALKGRSVLLVEDVKVNQMLATELLHELAGMEVTVAENGERAVEKLLANRYDAILMDIQMPVMDGFQATRLIRMNPENAKLPIIAMTAHAMTIEKERCLAAGMDDYVPKPINPDFLFAVLAKWIGNKNGDHT